VDADDYEDDDDDVGADVDDENGLNELSNVAELQLCGLPVEYSDFRGSGATLRGSRASDDREANDGACWRDRVPTALASRLPRLIAARGGFPTSSSPPRALLTVLPAPRRPRDDGGAGGAEGYVG
jgi:hypothetical protein